ncbi:maleate isomerase [Rhizobiales bacterium GAS191]|nr:maleate isomerase [Rhizobiales bacterium GAS113]SEC37947.1 maleate isomerase [Rhizobiales bacterium GAS191]
MDEVISKTRNSASEAGGLLVDLENLPFEIDAGIGSLAALGLLVLETDQTIEDEFRFLLPEAGVALYGARLHNDARITPETLAEMEQLVEPTVRLLPAAVELGVVGFACTSGALVIGEDTIAARIRKVRPDVPVTDPVTAARAAMAALGAKRVALLTPYVRRINESLRSALQARGMVIEVMGSFNQEDDNVVARVTPHSLAEAIIRLGSSAACDAVFVSCTSLRVARIVASVEKRLGKPVTSSNHALAWHMLRLAGCTQPLAGRGRLFEL